VSGSVVTYLFVGAVSIAVVTAEPHAAYHLRALDPVLPAGVVLRHVVPSCSPRQGSSLIEATDDITVVTQASRLVTVGGGLSAWTANIAQVANQAGVPVTYTQLAVLAAMPAPPVIPVIDHVTAVSVHDAHLLADYFHVSVADVTITGSPLLDEVASQSRRSENAQPGQSGVPRRVLLVGTSGLPERDRDMGLRDVGRHLRATGWQVDVALHPREQSRHLWDEFPHLPGPVLPAASTYDVVVMYPGTLTPLIAGLVPTVVYSPTAATEQELPRAVRSAMPRWVRSRTEVFAAIRDFHTTPPIPHHCEQFTGPVGGAARRVVDAWCSGGAPRNFAAVA